MEKGFNIQQATEEANRCLLCFDAPCSKNCPAGTDPAKFIRKLRMRNITGAIRTIKTNNILGGACGVLCPSSRLCEKECVAMGLERPIEIKKIQRALIEHAWQTEFFPLEADPPNGKRAAMIGAGPAGLACAAELAKTGFSVMVFEERTLAGGVLAFGVPDHRFDREFLAREIGDIEKLGVKFKFSSPIKTQEALGNLINEFDAVFIGTGLWQATKFLDGKGADGIFSSIDFLERLKNGEDLGRKINGRRVSVVGGGSVAIDSAESAVRLGAKDVYLIYRRSYKEMPAEDEEKISAQNLGVQFLLLNQPVGVDIKEGRVAGLKLKRTVLGDEDASGRRRPVDIEGGEWSLETDVVIEAVGNKVEKVFSNMPNTFAGGDVVRGPSLIVQAIADGKKAARAIMERE